MRQFDFSPLYRATVGFDQIADMFDRVLTSDTQTSSYPPYNIEKIDEDAYRISVAVAGFSEADLDVEVRENSLIIDFVNFSIFNVNIFTKFPISINSSI